ncbi:MAG: hypothetical protein ABR970_13205 [Roseiarcus sp.]|jgi:hypothetical protein
MGHVGGWSTQSTRNSGLDMKFGDLRSLAHNLADSFASGVGLLVGVHAMDVFGEAARSPGGFIEVDFLAGRASGGPPSASLERAIALYRDALPGFCARHRAEVPAFRTLRARYWVGYDGRRYRVTIEDRNGRRSVDDYQGAPGRRVRVLDRLGRVRRLGPRPDG